MDIIIRMLEKKDIAPLAEIESDSFSMPWSARDFEDLLTRDYCFYMVAEADGKPVACAGFTNICNEANIDNVVVAREYRGRGIAQKLLAELIRRGMEDGVEAFTLEVRVSNEAAIHVYEKVGFRSEGIRPQFYEKPVEDALIMWRR